MPAIDVSALRKVYHGVPAVDGISFQVQEGEVFGLLGPNGAGKTTTVECIEGLRVPDGGTITVLEHTHIGNANGIKEKIGIQLQATGLYPLHTVAELLALFGAFYKRALPPDDLIKLVSLEEKRNTRSKDLSGGQRQRLSLALALVNDPDLIFLDEPTTGLDPQSRRQIWQIVADLQRRGKTVMLTTHYMEEAQTLCDRVAVMDQGTIIALDSPHDLIATHFETTAIEFEDKNSAPMDLLGGLAGVKEAKRDGGLVTLYSADTPRTMEGLLAAARDDKLHFDDLRVRSATLEDVFLKLTGRRIRD
ncbi:MAG: ABC transporter ATP-binding protein [Anaerolineae bacterium]|nr:ABC transporter ATP-binding protein [Anaerolineae bacterium]